MHVRKTTPLHFGKHKCEYFPLRLDTGRQALSSTCTAADPFVLSAPVDALVKCVAAT